jgi:hypothetical protein
LNLYALNIAFDQTWVPFIVILSEKLQCSSSKFSPFDFYFYLEELSDVFDKTCSECSTTTKLSKNKKRNARH